MCTRNGSAQGTGWQPRCSVYLGSQSTFYRLLRAASGTGERRRQATHPAAVKPELQTLEQAGEDLELIELADAARSCFAALDLDSETARQVRHGRRLDGLTCPRR